MENPRNTFKETSLGIQLEQELERSTEVKRVKGECKEDKNYEILDKF